METSTNPWKSLPSKHCSKTSDLVRGGYGSRSESKSSSVSRAITFGSPISREKVNKMVREQMDQMRFCDRAKWGFDFYSERPASSCSNSSSSSSESKYEWKKSSHEGKTDKLGYTFYGLKKSSSSSSSRSPHKK